MGVPETTASHKQMILALAICLATSPLRMISEWKAPQQMPFERVHAVVRTPNEYYVGGLKGLVKGAPGQWQSIDERPVKQLLHVNLSIWVLYGDGSVDKIAYLKGNLFYDFLMGSVKRPWGSCLAESSNNVIIGGHGGWITRGDHLIETYRKELDGQVVTAVCDRDGTLWFGTQKNGLFRYTNGDMKRFGFAAGLPDSWVTTMLSCNGGLYVGMADGGIVRKENDRFVPFDSPCRKVRLLTSFNGKLAVGGMEGCWIQDGTGWQQLSTEEATCLTVINKRIAVGSPTGLKWFSN